MRSDNRFLHHYIIMLTAKSGSENVVEGLESGANDYIVKPFNARELKARIEVGQRVISLQQQLENKVLELNLALEEVKTLTGMLPICSYCKKVRDDND